MLSPNEHIRPMDYAMSAVMAADRVEEERAIYLSAIDMAVLNTLYSQPKGIRCNPLMYAARGKRMNVDAFHKCLEKLLGANYITKRTFHLRKTMYYISIEGRTVLDELDAYVFEIVHKQKGQH